mmetsp:Transcript_40704/g.53392  ORF Transcript_40704/g.53392 Transcript_40704/m.53392 type:complete len:85 (-) Transcript_40704:135-389(-)
MCEKLGVEQRAHTQVGGNAFNHADCSYLAPELLEGGKIGAASDIWALGVAFYALATGHFPFESGDQIMSRCLEFPQRSLLSNEF